MEVTQTLQTLACHATCQYPSLTGVSSLDPRPSVLGGKRPLCVFFLHRLAILNGIYCQRMALAFFARREQDSLGGLRSLVRRPWMMHIDLQTMP